MNTPPNKAKTLWIVAAGIGIVLVLIMAIVVMIVTKNTQPDSTSPEGQNVSRQSTDAVATETEVKRELDELDKSLEELKSDQDAAKASSNDSKQQIKVGS